MLVVLVVVIMINYLKEMTKWITKRKIPCTHFYPFLKDYDKGRVQKLKSAKVWSLTIEGGGGSANSKSLFRFGERF